MGGHQRQSHVTFWLRSHVKNEKNLHLQFHNIYGHQTWQSGNLWLEDPTHLVKPPFDNAVTWKMKKNLYLHLRNTYGHQTPPTNSSDLLIAWSRDKWKKL